MSLLTAGVRSHHTHHHKKTLCLISLLSLSLHTPTGLWPPSLWRSSCGPLDPALIPSLRRSLCGPLVPALFVCPLALVLPPVWSLPPPASALLCVAAEGLDAPSHGHRGLQPLGFDTPHVGFTSAGLDPPLCGHRGPRHPSAWPSRAMTSLASVAFGSSRTGFAPLASVVFEHHLIC